MMNDLQKLFSMPNKENFNSKLMSLPTQIGLTMLENHGRPTRQGGAFAGLGDRMQGVAQYNQHQEEKQRAQEQKNKTMQYLQANDPEAFEIATATGDPMQGFQFHMQKRSQKPAERNILKGADGFNYYTDTGERVLPGVEKPLKAPAVKTLTLDDGSEAAVQWDGNQGSWVPIDAPHGGGTANPRGKLTESEAKYALFGRMQEETAPVLDSLEAQFNPANTQDAMARSLPIAGNFFQSEQGQMYNTAAAAWSEGALRIATGAAATQPEIERTQDTYFAQPGDTPNTIHFKSEMRKMYSRALEAARGGQNIDGQLPDPMEFAQSFAVQNQQQAPGGVGSDDLDSLLEHMPPEDRALFESMI